MSQLQIDWTRCDGHGLCTEVFPEAITSDEWGYPMIPRPRISAHQLRDAQRAVALCPALALRLEQTPDVRR
jgi:ferredoxin